MKNKYSPHGKITLENMSTALWYNQWLLSLFQEFLLSKAILEVGCGTGNFTKKLSTLGDVYAIDIDPSLVRATKHAIKKGAKVGFGNIEKGTYFFKRRQFDAIICLNVLEHIKDDNRSLKNMSSLLKPGGILILLVPSHKILYGAIDKAIGHYRRYDKNHFYKMVKKNGLSVIHNQHVNVLGGLGWLISGKLLNDTTVGAGKLKLFDKIAPFILPFEQKLHIPFGTSILLIAKKNSKRYG